MNFTDTLKATANIVSVPMGMCAYKTAADITMKLVPRRVSTPIKIAYKVGSVGIGMIADHLVVDTMETLATTVEAATELRKLKKESKKGKVVIEEEERD